MKKLLSFALALLILLGISLCAFADSAGNEPTDTPTATPAPTAAPTGTPEPSAQPTSSPAPTSSPKPSTAPSGSPKPTASSMPSASPSASPTTSAEPSPGEKPVIKKHPTRESIYAGGSCIFTANAENYKWVIWYFANGKSVVNASDAAAHFSGLTVRGANSIILTLENVPSTLNGWRVAAVFGNDAGKTTTDNAYLEVLGSSSKGSTSGGSTSNGSTSKSGTSGSSTSGGKTSAKTTFLPSDYEDMIQAFTPMPIATPTPTPANIWVRTYENESPEQETEAPVSAENKGGEPNTKSTSALSTLFIIIGIVAVVLLLCVTVIVLMLIKRGYDIEGIIMAIRKAGAKKQDSDYIGRH